jgi:2-isopropylmalate synthase
MRKKQAENYVRVFDTTLRDGEQSPGATMTSREKLDVAKALARLGVDIIEAGFPAASPDDLAAVKRIATSIGNSEGAELSPSGEPPVICGLARAARNDIDRAFEAVSPAKYPRIHTFIATSDIHMQHKLRMSRNEVLSRVSEMVGYARSLCNDVEFSPEDAGRSDPEFLFEVLTRAIEAGASTLNIPDTVGYTTPDEYGALIEAIIKNVPNIDRAVVSVHCHNDLGLATANSLAGLRAGARQVEVAVNGIGERAGNTALEEIVMTLRTRRNRIGLDVGIDSTQIARVSKLVSSYTGMSVQPNKAIVGANAFAHEAGIHQDGMLKHQETYEIMRPETVGVAHSQLVLGKHSGRHAVRVRLLELGYELTDADLDKAFERFKRLADRKKTISDADLDALVADEIKQPREVYSLVALQVTCGTTGMPTATVRLRGPDEVEVTHAAVGQGPVHAVFKAIDDIIASENSLREFSVQSVTEGIDALGKVTVRVQYEGAPRVVNAQHDGGSRTFGGYGADVDIVVASAKAYLSATNKALNAFRRLKNGQPIVSGPQPDAAAES